jgi:hypothetical protein
LQHTNAPRPRFTRVFGVRLLYQPRWRRRLALAAAAAGVVVYAVSAVVQLAGLGQQSLRWDFAQFHQAAVDLAAGRDPYAGFLTSCPAQHWCQGGYIFPPLLAELLRPLAGMRVETAAVVWLLITHVLVLATVVVMARALRDLLSTNTALVLLAASLFFLPLYSELYFLQVGTLLTLLLALAGTSLLRDAGDGDTAAGVWLALAAVLRVTPLLQAPALLRLEAGPKQRRVRARGLAAMLIVATALLLLLALATPYTATYFREVLPRIGGGTGSLDNVSLPGLLVRILRPPSEWDAGLPGATLILVALTLAFVVPTWLMWQRALRGWLDGARARGLGYAAILAASPIVSSITWQHHLVVELLVLALLAPTLQLRRTGVAGRRLRMGSWLAVVGYALMSLDRHVTDQVVIALGLAQPAGVRLVPFLLITSANLVGMICLWLACLAALDAAVWSEAAEGEDADLVVRVHDAQAAAG